VTEPGAVQQFRERLVDQFIDIADWPTSRKTAWLTGVLIPVQAFGSLVTSYSYRSYARWGLDQPLMDVALNDRFLAVWLAGVVAVFLLSLPAARAGREGRWTAFLFVVVYAAGMCGLIYLRGTMSTPLMAFYPVAMFLMALYYDERVGLFAFIYASLLFALIGALELAGVLPYAPVVLARSLEAQSNLAWFTTHFFAVTLAFGFCILLGLAIVLARRAQQSRLLRAHEELFRTEQMLERGNRLIRRYVPTQVADKLLSDAYEEMERTRRVKLTMFFSDIEHFTATSDEMEPEELAALLNEYLSEMTAIADRFHGIVDQLVGDGIMIFFGAPDATNDHDHALRAIRMALAMQQRMNELTEGWFRRGIQAPFRIRIGINTGYASVGNFGSPGRMVYSAVGNQVNLTARIQTDCEPGKVMVSHSTWALVQDDFVFVDKGEITVKGIHYPIRVYEVVASNGT
jgi:adenylate cyclase